MDDFIVVTDSGTYYVVRTSDWQVVARCSSVTDANLVAAALN